jgi:LPXTG-site transpeptidase (sortase) family protein
LKTGLLLLIVSTIFGVVSWAVRPQGPNSDQMAALEATALAANRETPTPFLPNMELEDVWESMGNQDELETLPDYPIPTPVLEGTAEAEQQALDTSAVTRIRIPALGVDTIVKYVPFDGITWMIAGLQNEVAWLGETSWPGLGSNTVLAGHVTLRNGGYGPFRYLEDLQMGDQIVVHTQEKIYTYGVREVRVVEETDMSVAQKTDDSQLTLVTCTEWDQDTQLYLKRLVAFTTLIGAEPLFKETAGN